MVSPPDTLIVCPEMYAASSLSRNAIMLESSGFQRRRNGIARAVKFDIHKGHWLAA
jgi:hypothetical protein